MGKGAWRRTENLLSPCLLCVLGASVVEFSTVTEEGVKEKEGKAEFL